MKLEIQKDKFNYPFWVTRTKILLLLYTLKWILIAGIIGCMVGSSSAFFLFTLDWVTNWRESHVWIIALLPLGGLLIGITYHYLGKGAEGGNNLIISQINQPTSTIPWKMAPLVLIATLLTHFFGGSAGREGTAVQMGGALADQLSLFKMIKRRDRIKILISGISAGFASVFGTPLAGAVFGLEVYLTGNIRYQAIFPSVMAAVVANHVCDLWGVQHTIYSISIFPHMNASNFLWTILAGVIFGLTARLFSKLTFAVGQWYKKNIPFAPFRPALGGIVVAAAVWLIGTTKYIGLGIPTILASFHEPLPIYDFGVKIIFTALTLGAFFKGGEVTPLFFIGATLGNALSLIFPLPMELLAGIGFVAVFAGAANTPLSSTLMAIELFGIEIGVFAGVACVVAYLFSGRTGIYSSQKIGIEKHLF